MSSDELNIMEGLKIIALHKLTEQACIETIKTLVCLLAN